MVRAAMLPIRPAPGAFGDRLDLAAAQPPDLEARRAVGGRALRRRRGSRARPDAHSARARPRRARPRGRSCSRRRRAARPRRGRADRRCPRRTRAAPGGGAEQHGQLAREDPAGEVAQARRERAAADRIPARERVRDRAVALSGRRRGADLRGDPRAQRAPLRARDPRRDRALRAPRGSRCRPAAPRRAAHRRCCRCARVGRRGELRHGRADRQRHALLGGGDRKRGDAARPARRSPAVPGFDRLRALALRPAQPRAAPGSPSTRRRTPRGRRPRIARSRPSRAARDRGGASSAACESSPARSMNSGHRPDTTSRSRARVIPT